ncbi:hypothetical protein B0H10DRAFT_1959285 [Mycena sp. CBHHK59/15]|nr:hypothetical protein B0H10DRAFT_1959285 [Mycena sp. CBHHK59/15]
MPEASVPPETAEIVMLHRVHSRRRPRSQEREFACTLCAGSDKIRTDPCAVQSTAAKSKCAARIAHRGGSSRRGMDGARRPLRNSAAPERTRRRHRSADADRVCARSREQERLRESAGARAGEAASGCESTGPRGGDLVSAVLTRPDCARRGCDQTQGLAGDLERTVTAPVRGTRRSR